jgi:hypothetical protein
MRLLLLHGINQQGKNSEIIRDAWISYLANPACIAELEILAPLYGDVLADQIEAATPEQAITQGIPGEDEEREFVVHALQQLALDQGVTNELIRTEVVTQGPLDDRRFIAILQLLEKLSPLQGRLALLLIRQAYAYLKRQHVTEAVDAIVEPVLGEGPCIVVGHSLGSVIGFKLLRKLQQTVPLFLTLGSPLGIVAVQSALRKPRRVPIGVSRWYNGVDPDDLVTMGKALTSETFADGIVNKTDIDNGDDAHAIEGCLRDTSVRQEICSGAAATPSSSAST